MVLPKHYYSGLSKKNTKEQLKELEKSRELYKKGIYHQRKKMSSFKSKKSRHVVEFEKKYCVSISDLNSVSKVTGLPVSALNRVIKKGMGAYYSGGSRPNQNAHSWAYARLASTLLKHNSYRVDKHIIDDAGGKIKPPPKKKCNKEFPNSHIKSMKKSKNSTQHGGKRMKKNRSKRKSRISLCCDLTPLTEKTNKRCKTKDGRVFELPRRFSKSKCAQGVRGFTMKSSCTPYKFCNT